MSNSVSGNQYFTTVKDTVVTTAAVNEALTIADVRPLKYVQGTVTPTAAGSYAVVDSNSVNIQLPANALVSHIFLRGTGLVGGTNAQPQLSATAGAAGTALSVVVVTADLLVGESPVVTATTGLTNTYLTITTTGTYTAGTLTVTLLYQSL